MQFTVERDALLKELGRVTGVIERKTTIPIMGNVHIDAGAAGLLLRATDLEIQAEAPCRAEVAIQGVTTVDGRLLHDFVKRSASGVAVSATLDAARSRLKVVAGRSRFEMLATNAEDFPQLDARRGAGNRSFLLDAGVLRGMIDPVRFAVSTDETRPYLHGIYFHQCDRQLAAVATDGHRMSVKMAQLPDGADGMIGVLLPRKLTSELLRVMPDSGPVSVEVSDASIELVCAELRVTSKLLAGTYPDWQRLIPLHAHGFVVDRERFTQGIERVALALDEKQAGMLLGVQSDGLYLACRGGAHGMAEDEFDAVVDGPAVDIGINHRYLRDCLAACTGSRVYVGYQNAASPMLIRAEDDEEMAHRMVIMPMHVPAIREQREAA